jgi:hypothetical protein
MLETFIGVALAIGLRDLVHEGIARYQQYKTKKNWQALIDLAEDFEADDEDL